MQYAGKMQRCSLSTILMQVASSLNEKEGKSEDFKEMCQLLNLPLASNGHPEKFICDAVGYISLSQLSLLPLKAVNSDLKSMWCDH